MECLHILARYLCNRAPRVISNVILVALAILGEIRLGFAAGYAEYVAFRLVIVVIDWVEEHDIMEAAAIWQRCLRHAYLLTRVIEDALVTKPVLSLSDRGRV